MNVKSCLAIGLVLASALTISAQAVEPGEATCGSQTISDQCRITWTFARPSGARYWVQQLDPWSGAWRNLNDHYTDGTTVPDGTTAQGSRDAVVEPGYLYRVLACDDARASINCAGSKLVWAPFIQPAEQVHLIPRLVPVQGPDGRFDYCGVLKNIGWAMQVTQYNICLMVTAVTRAKVELPDMTPPPDIRVMPSADPIGQLQFNVWAAYLGERGTPLVEPELEPIPRPPHEHPERHPR